MTLRLFRPLALIIASIALAATLRAASFEYSYTFQAGQTVTGSLQGDVVGSYVENVSNITMIVNGVGVNYEILMLNQDGATNDLISFDVELNRFYLRPAPNGTGYQFGFWHNDQWPQYVSLFTPDMFVVPGQAGFDYSPGPNSWSLVETSARVPDCSSSAAALSVSFAALAAFRLRMKRRGVRVEPKF